MYLSVGIDVHLDYAIRHCLADLIFGRTGTTVEDEETRMRQRVSC